MSVALVFPGQGSQYVGMHKDLDPAVFAAADEALGLPLSRVIAEGPESELQRTELTQPGIFAVSYARLQRLRAERPELEVVVAAGHSLGEYGALVAAGSLDFADAVRLLHLRGKAMQAAVPVGEGAMAAVMGLDADALRGLLRPHVEIAAYNSHNQLSIAGPTPAVEEVCRLVEDAGGVAKRLAVSAPFHCAMLTPAGQTLRGALAEVTVRPPAFPVVQNVDAETSADPDTIRAKLVAQVSAPVLWSACFAKLRGFGATRAIEVGPGRTLAGLGKRIDRALPVEVSDT